MAEVTLNIEGKIFAIAQTNLEDYVPLEELAKALNGKKIISTELRDRPEDVVGNPPRRKVLFLNFK